MIRKFLILAITVFFIFSARKSEASETCNYLDVVFPCKDYYGREMTGYVIDDDKSDIYLFDTLATNKNLVSESDSGVIELTNTHWLRFDGCTNLQNCAHSSEGHPDQGEYTGTYYKAGAGYWSQDVYDKAIPYYVRYAANPYTPYELSVGMDYDEITLPFTGQENISYTDVIGNNHYILFYNWNQGVSELKFTDLNTVSITGVESELWTCNPIALVKPGMCEYTSHGEINKTFSWLRLVDDPLFSSRDILDVAGVNVLFDANVQTNATNDIFDLRFHTDPIISAPTCDPEGNLFEYALCRSFVPSSTFFDSQLAVFTGILSEKYPAYSAIQSALSTNANSLTASNSLTVGNLSLFNSQAVPILDTDALSGVIGQFKTWISVFLYFYLAIFAIKSIHSYFHPGQVKMNL